MARPTIDARDMAFLLAAYSPQSGGSLWMTVKSAEPIELETDRDVLLRIEIASDQSVLPTLILGGLAAESVRACEGVGAFIDPGEAMLTYEELETSTQSLLSRYMQKVPGRSEIFGYAGEDTMSEADALARLQGMAFRMDYLQLANASERVWDYGDEPWQTYPVQVATLTCTFDRRSLLQNRGSITAFAAPDLVAGVSQLGEGGLIRLDHDFQVVNNAGFSRTAATFVNSREYVDEATGDRVVSFSGDWWYRNSTGTRGVLLSGGSVVFEPEDAPARRVIARMLAALCASFSITLALMVVRRGLNRIEVLN